MNNLKDKLKTKKKGSHWNIKIKIEKKDKMKNSFFLFKKIS